MTRRKVFIAFAAAVMILVLTAALFVACDQTKTYTVTFKDGETVVKTVSVKDGATIADADLPADPTKDSAVFEGWFDGDKAFDKTAAITGDVTYTAKWTSLFTVTFKDGDTVIATATVKDGEKIAASDIPANLAKEGYRFNGWFVGDTKITADYAVNDSVIATASFTLIGKEAGTYTDKAGVGAELVLDGIDSGTLGGVTISYTINGDIVTISEDMYKLVGSEYIINDKMAGAYSHTIEGPWGGTVTFTLDGYGNVVGTEVADSYVAEPENGTYIVANGKLAMTFPNYSYWDCEYTIKADGNVLSSVDSTTNEEVAYIKAGYVVPTAPADAFTGLWTAADGSIIEIAVENGVSTVKEAGVVVDGCFFNWDYSVLSVPIQNSYYNDSYAVVDGKLVKNGETQYTKSNASDIRVSVKFVVDGATVATAQTTYGQAISQNDIPEDPTAELGYSFRGWFSGDVEFNEDALVYTDVTYTAKFEQTQAIVSFVNGTETVSTIAVDFGAKFASNQIPAAPSGDGVFLGWYCGTSKAESGSAIKSGMKVVYTALFVNQDSYQGAFVDKTNGVMAVFTADGKVSVMGISNKAWNYDSKTGSAVYTEGSYTAKHTYTMTRIGDTLKLVHEYFDDIDPVDETFTLEKANGTISGTFYKSRTFYMVVQDGAITYMGSSAIPYGFITKAGSNVSIKWKTSATSAMQSVRGKISEDGTITIAQAGITANGIWVKYPVERKEFYNSDLGYIHEFTTENGIIYTYEDKAAVFTVATTDVLLTDGAIATITYGSKELIVKITGTNFIAAGAERGTHTGADGALVLDGFGKAKLGDAAETSYTVNGKGYVLIGEKAYVLKDGAYTVLTEKDGYQNKFKLDGGVVTLELDGFGGAIARRYSYVYSGTYTVDTAKNEITFAEVDEENSRVYVDGTYSIVEDGNAYVNTSRTWVKEGYTVENKLAVGYWESADKTSNLEIMSYEAYVYVRIDGKNAQVPTCNYNSSVLTVKVDSKSLEIKRDGDNLVYNGIVYSAATRTTDTTKLFGTWQVAYNKLFTFEFLEDGNVNIVCLASSTNTTKTKTVKFAQKDSVYSFEYDYDTYICTLADGVMTITSTDSDGYTNFKDLPATKIADPEVVETLDDFAGTWKTSDGKLSWTFDGKGTVTNEEGNSFAYTISNGKAKFVNNALDIECSISGNTMTVSYDDGDAPFSKTFTKQAAETLDAFAGTWSGKVGHNNLTVVCDGKGNIKVGDTSYTYTIADGKIVAGCYTFTKSGDTIKAVYDDGEYNFEGTLTKQA